MPFDPIVFADRSKPALNAAALAHMQTQYDQAVADAATAANAAYGQVFQVSAYETIHAAYAALVSAGGGTLQIRGDVSVETDFIMSENVTCLVDGYGGRLLPAPGVIALGMEVGPSDVTLIAVEGLEIDATNQGGTAGGATGIRVKDHLGAVIRDVVIKQCATGILITDSPGKWSESSQLDAVRIEECAIGIDVQNDGGTGSFGYAGWGRVAIYGVPEGGVGFRVGAGANLYHFTLARLVVQTSGAVASGTATLMEVAGVIRRDSTINAVFESSASAFSGTRNGLALVSGATIDGLGLRAYFQGTFTNKIYNPATVAFQFREDNDRDLKASASGQDLADYWVFGDAFARTIMRPGRIMLGSGAAAPDAQIVRWGPDLAGPDTGDSWRVDGTWNGGNLRLGNYRLWVDASGNLRIKSSAPSSDMDGTVVGAQS
ncbi:MAG TPA: hypothetical protein VNR37_03525 [Microbacteriaceae bacterium]|nr:hypothetical protein [Microbacteriaceae bacterium]